MTVLHLIRNAHKVPTFLWFRYYWWREGAFDRRYGTETLQRVKIDRHSVVFASDEHCYDYEAVRVKEFKKMMRSVPLDPAHADFVDFGSGKGRALLLAALLGFQRITGIEFSPALVERAQANLRAFRERTGSTAPIEVRHADATEYMPDDEPSVFFFYNPFGWPVMQKVLERIRSRKAPSYIVYRNPTCAAEMAKLEFLELVSATRAWIIYAVR